MRRGVRVMGGRIRTDLPFPRAGLQPRRPHTQPHRREGGQYLTKARVTHHAATIAILIALSGCASKPEIAIQSYCEIKSTELIDMRDRGIRGLSEANKKAVLAGDDNWLRECKLGDRSNSGGPR
jgi:hypothetical protein